MTDQLTFNLVYGRDDNAANFVVGEPNRAAVDWLQRYPDWDAPGLVIFGPEGVGKMHLAKVWGARCAAQEVTTAQDIEDFFAADCLQPVIIPEADVFCTDRRNCEALFHLYQRLSANEVRMLLIAGSPPQQWDIPLADLASRLRALPQVEMKGPDDQLCESLLLKYFSERGISVDADVLNFLLPRVPRDADELKRIAVALDQDSLAGQKRLSLKGVRLWAKENLV